MCEETGTTAARDGGVERRRGAGAAGAIGARRSAGGEKVAGAKVAINFSSRD